MKKILSLLASIGLVATTSSLIVSCTSTEKKSDEKVKPKDEIKVDDPELKKVLDEQTKKVEELSKQYGEANNAYLEIKAKTDDYEAQLKSGKIRVDALYSIIQNDEEKKKVIDKKVEALQEEISSREKTMVENRIAENNWGSHEVNEATRIIKEDTEKLLNFEKPDIEFEKELRRAEVLLAIKDKEAASLEPRIGLLKDEQLELLDRVQKLAEERMNLRDQMIDEDEETGEDLENAKKFNREIMKELKEKDLEMSAVSKRLKNVNKKLKILQASAKTLEQETSNLYATISHHLSDIGRQDNINKNKAANAELISHLQTEIKEKQAWRNKVIYDTNKYAENIKQAFADKQSFIEQISTLRNDWSTIDNKISKAKENLQIQLDKYQPLEDEYEVIKKELKVKEKAANTLQEELNKQAAIKQDLELQLNH